jgi:hypothetical protein
MRRSLQVIFAVATIAFMVPLAFQLFANEYPIMAFYTHRESYEPGLAYLDDMETLQRYLDNESILQSIMDDSGEVIDKEQYVRLVDKTLKDRFYHGYSHYSWWHNYMAYLAGKFVWSDLSAIVLPDDILKYPHAACSQ